jgi:hypothetical protein
MISNEIMNLLIRSFDEDLEPADKVLLDKSLAESKELREEKEKLKEMRGLLYSTSYSFGSGFKEKVMEEVQQEKEPVVLHPDFNRALHNGFKKIWITGVAAIVLLLLSVYLTEGSFDVFTGNDLTSDENLISYIIYEDFNK